MLLLLLIKILKGYLKSYQMKVLHLLLHWTIVLQQTYLLQKTTVKSVVDCLNQCKAPFTQ